MTNRCGFEETGQDSGAPIRWFIFIFFPLTQSGGAAAADFVLCRLFNTSSSLPTYAHLVALTLGTLSVIPIVVVPALIATHRLLW